MSNKTENLDELLECAIRENGIKRHMEALAVKERRRRSRVRYFSYGVAACLAVACGVWLNLRSDVMRVGYEFAPADGQAGGSEITALMQERKIQEARDMIVSAKARVEAEMRNPQTADPDYLTQLAADLDELNLLDAVCLMRSGKYFKSKTALKALADGNGAAAEDARRLLQCL